MSANDRVPQRRRLGPLLAAFAVGVLLAACPPGSSGAGEATVRAAASPATVEIDNHAFAPATLTIAAGTMVTWKNKDDTAHTVRDVNKAFASDALDTDDTYSHTFAKPGEYEYFCSLHPYMVGRIVVKPAGSSS